MKKGTVLGKHFVLNEKIGQGQFAEVYTAYTVRNQSDVVAVKVDKSCDVKILGREALILRDLQKSEFVCKFIATGKVGDGRRYCVMELLGDSLSRYMKSKQLELVEIVAIGKEILMGIRDIHNAGYIHRDIKPSNCAIRVGGRCGMPRWTLLDFGLARKVIGSDGRHMPERKDTSFRGTTGYASIHAHQQRDLSWRDDLWSWFYTIVEMLQGTLPWKVRRHDESFDAADGPVAHKKRACIRNLELLVPRTSAYFSQMEDISNYLSKLEFDEVPDYLLLRDLMDSIGQLGLKEKVVKGLGAPHGNPMQIKSMPHCVDPEDQRENASKEMMHVEQKDISKEDADVSNAGKNPEAYEQKCHDNINQLISILKTGGYSSKGQMMIDMLREVTPGEAIAVFCDHMSRMSVENGNIADIVEIMKELSGYFAALSRLYQKM